MPSTDVFDDHQRSWTEYTSSPWARIRYAVVRKTPFGLVESNLESLGCTVVGRYGGRVANDLVTDEARKHDPDFYADLERLELALCDQEPFWRTGAFWQLVAQAQERSDS